MFGNGTEARAFESLFIDDDEELRLRYPDDEEFIADDEEFLGNVLGAIGSVAGLPGRLVGTAVQTGANAINTLVNGPRKPATQVRAPQNWGAQVPGSSAATVMTPGGPVPVKFQKAFITKAQLEAALEGVRRDIGAVRTAVQAVDDKHAKSIDSVSKTTATAIAADAAKTKQDLQKLEARLSKKIDDNKQFALMMSLMGDTGGSNDMLLPLLMMGGGDNGGGFDNNMMMMLLATGAFK